LSGYGRGGSLIAFAQAGPSEQNGGLSNTLRSKPLGKPGAANNKEEESMSVVDSRLIGKPVPRISREMMERDHVARADAKGSTLAFLDQRLPAYEREIINMVGMGVTENPEATPHVKAGAVGFSVTYVRALKGKGSSLHRHATEEVFIPIKGRWQIVWLEGDDERTVDLDVGDVCNAPIGIYRGFRSVSDDPDALLIVIVGGPDAGKVDWHSSVVAEARKTGLSVDDDGNLIVEKKPAA
jgi:quercetin dioxygenase-like cupin family protein